MLNDEIFLVDSHCHLNFPEFNGKIEQIVANAKQNGVGLLQTICTKSAEFADIYKIAEQFPNVYASVGVHPHEALTDVAQYDFLIESAKLPKTIGLGETGLDYYYENSPAEEQKRNFHTHIEAAQECGLPVIIHTRDAEDDTIEILQKTMSKKPYKALLHCFTGTEKLAKAALEMGLYISISGIVTFKNAQALRDVVKIIPMERLLVETDAPFLAPIPNRRKVCEPAYTRLTAECVAELKEVDIKNFANSTTANFLKLFDKVRL